MSCFPLKVEHGLTGSFKDRPISDWLVKHNPSPLDYERAVHNFTASCAGYSVATYVFGNLLILFNQSSPRKTDKFTETLSW